MSIEPESTIYSYHYNQNDNRYLALTNDLQEASQDPEYTVATYSDVMFWAAGNDEVFNGVIHIQEGDYIYIEDEESETYKYVNVEDLSLENEKEFTFA
jgi:hypothetical protein